MDFVRAVEVEEAAQARPVVSRSYKLDLTRGRILRAGSIDGLASIQQTIKKAILTPRFRCLIYDNQYGSEIQQVITAEDATLELAEAEIPRLIREALIPDTRIFEVQDFEFDFVNDRAYISFTAQTVFGELVINEVF